MTHITNNIYQCNRTLRRFTRRVEWEYGTLCVIYDPLT